MKKYIITLSVFVGLIFTIIFFINKSNRLENELKTSYSNIKAFVAENDSVKSQNRVFSLTIEELEYYNDSIFVEMQKVIKELKIKEKEIARLEYLTSTITKTDSIVIKDTIFVENLAIDTTLKDQWYSLNLVLKYPSTIVVSPEFKSDLYIITYDKRETVKPPSKCFLVRWLQKRHTIRVVEIYEKSPYIKHNKQRFVEIIK